MNRTVLSACLTPTKRSSLRSTLMRTLFTVTALMPASLAINLAAAHAEDTSKKKADLEVVVTASRGEAQNALSVPQATSIVSREELDSSAYTDVDDAIRQEAGISLAPAEGNPNYWQEGFSLRGLGAQRVLTLTDGVRQAGQGIGYGGGNLSLYNPYDIERIEIIKGPGSVLYGTDAFGGVINIISREPEKRDTFGTNMGASYTFDSSRDSHRYGGYLDLGSQGWGGVISGGFLDSDVPNLPSDQEDATTGSFKNYSFSTKFDVDLGDKTNLRLLGNMDNNDDVIIADSQLPLPIAVFGAPGSSQLVSSPLAFSFPHYNRSLVGAEITKSDLSDTVKEVKSGLSWTRLDRKFHRETAFYPTFSPGFSGPPTFVDTSAQIVRSIVNTDDTVDTYEWQNQARLDLGEQAVTVGLDLGFDQSDLPETEEQQIVAIAGPGAIPGIPSTFVSRKRADAEQTRVGVYAQDTLKVDGVEINPGLRVDYYGVKNKVTDFTDDEIGVSGSIGGVYRPIAEQSVYATLGSGFRAPDLGERFQKGIVNLGVPSQLIGTENLNPERAWTAEVGTKTERKDYTFNFAGFTNYIDDYIGTTALGPVQGVNTDVYDNVGSVTLRGVEASGNYHLCDKSLLFANASRTWVNFSDKIDAAGWTFNYGARYTAEIGSEMLQRVVAGISARSVMKSDDNTVTSGRDAFTGGSFTTLDLTLNLDLTEASWGKAKIVSGLRNLFDRSYREPFFDLYQPGRNGYVGVQLDY